MQQLFYSFWRLIFPVGLMAYGAFQSWLKFRQQKAMMDLIRSFAEKGMEPPEALLQPLWPHMLRGLGHAVAAIPQLIPAIVVTGVASGLAASLIWLSRRVLPL